MELNLLFNYNTFWKSISASNDNFGVKIDSITSYYTEDSRPPTIQIKIRGDKHTRFLKKRIDVSPEIIIYKYEWSAFICSPIEKIKNKLI